LASVSFGGQHLAKSRLLRVIKDLHDTRLSVGEDIIVVLGYVVQDHGKLAFLFSGKIQFLAQMLEFELTAEMVPDVFSIAAGVAVEIHHESASRGATQKDQSERNHQRRFGALRRRNQGSHPLVLVRRQSDQNVLPVGRAVVRSGAIVLGEGGLFHAG